MQIEPLNLSHQYLIEQRFRSLKLSLSEYSFANLYLFRDLHRYQVITYETEVFIKGVTRDHAPFMMLTSSPSHLSPHTLQMVLSQTDILFPIPDSWLLSLEKWTVQTSFRESDSDYLFAISKLAHYPGRHLSKKRNLVKQLLTAHDVKVETFSKQLEEDAQQILEQWQQEHGGALTETDYIPCQEAIHSLQKLNLHGQVIYVDQHPAGLIIGEWISQDCYTIHFSKASRTIKGLYQYLYQALAQSIEKKSLWINMEQDLGIPTVRDAKHSYLPDQILRKWRVQISIQERI